MAVEAKIDAEAILKARIALGPELYDFFNPLMAPRTGLLTTPYDADQFLHACLKDDKGPTSHAAFLVIVHEHTMANKFYDWKKADEYITQHIQKDVAEMKVPASLKDLIEDLRERWFDIEEACAGVNLDTKYLEDALRDGRGYKYIRWSFEKLLQAMRPDYFASAKKYM